MATRRAEGVRSRQDERTWVMERRERTRRLIELGGLVQKSGLADRLQDDSAALYGVLLHLVDELSGEAGASLLELSRRRGKRAFEAEGAGRSELDDG